MDTTLVAAQNGRFAAAIDSYESILASGEESATLYYNLGYAYYKSGSLGKAILNFERAKRLDPNNADINFNLEQAYSQTDQMQTLEPVFFVRWWNGFKNIMGSDGWAVAFIVLFVVTLLGAAAFLFADGVAMRKSGFFGGIVALLLCVMSLSISLDKRDEILNSREGIIMMASVTMTTSPDKNGSEMAVLHEGTHVSVLSELGEWLQVSLKDGNVGWLKKTEIELI